MNQGNARPSVATTSKGIPRYSGKASRTLAGKSKRRPRQADMRALKRSARTRISGNRSRPAARNAQRDSGYNSVSKAYAKNTMTARMRPFRMARALAK